MPRINLPWGSWYGTGSRSFEFPDEWKLAVAHAHGGPVASAEEISSAFERPIGSKRLRLLAEGKKSAAIAVDDLTRPTEGAQLLPYVLNELSEGGIPPENISIIIALGSHRALTYDDIAKKVGSDILRQYRVTNHSPFSNLVDFGMTARGSKITVNKDFAEAELKIAVGFIVPHAAAGWGGGAKIVMPGLCGIETLSGVHGGELQALHSDKPETGRKRMREEIEEIAERIGLDFIINVVGDSRGRATKVITGAPRPAHGRGVELAILSYTTTIDGPFDIGFFNAYPEDTEFIQAGKAFNYLSMAPTQPPVRDGGTLVIITAASEGHGVHYLMDEGMPLYERVKGHKRLINLVGSRTLYIYSPRLTAMDRRGFPADVQWFDEWSPLIDSISRRHEKAPRAVVFSSGPLQIPG